MISAERLAELKQLVEKATPGPWEFRATKDSGGIKFVVAPNGPKVGVNRDMEFIPADCSHTFNGKFIAESRTALPELISAYEKLQKERDDCLETVMKFERDNESLMDDVEALEAKAAKLQAAARTVIEAKSMDALQHAVAKLHYCMTALDSGDK